jgi:hypothetical protein
VQVLLYISGDQKGDGQAALAGRAFVLGYTNPYLCVSTYLDYNTHFNNDCTVEVGSSAYVNYNINQKSPNPKLTEETSGTIFEYVRYPLDRVIGKQL